MGELDARDGREPDVVAGLRMDPAAIRHRPHVGEAALTSSTKPVTVSAQASGARMIRRRVW